LCCTSGEISCHFLLYRYNLASKLLARFQNGILYKFVAGKPCSETDIRRESVWRGVARTMGHWHAILPTASLDENIGQQPYATSQKILSTPSPNIWTLLQKWIHALPTRTPAEGVRQAQYQKELERLVDELGETSGPGGDGVCMKDLEFSASPTSPFFSLYLLTTISLRATLSFKAQTPMARKQSPLLTTNTRCRPPLRSILLRILLNGRVLNATITCCLPGLYGRSSCVYIYEATTLSSADMPMRTSNDFNDFAKKSTCFELSRASSGKDIVMPTSHVRLFFG
jgi:Choline/ethanolamine kinase